MKLGQPGPHQQHPVEESDAQARHQGQRHPHPDVEGELVGQDRAEQRRRRGLHPRREVELAADHEQGDADGHDAQQRRGVQEVGDSGPGAKRRREGEEEREHRGGTHRSPELRTSQRLPQR